MTTHELDNAIADVRTDIGVFLEQLITCTVNEAPYVHRKLDELNTEHVQLVIARCRAER